MRVDFWLIKTRSTRCRFTASISENTIKTNWCLTILLRHRRFCYIASSPIWTQKTQKSIGFSIVFWFSGFGPKSLIWRLLGLLAASVLTSHYRPMLISRKHINSQLILSKMRFMTPLFGIMRPPKSVCASKQKTPLAAVKLTFLQFTACIFI